MLESGYCRMTNVSVATRCPPKKMLNVPSSTTVACLFDLFFSAEAAVEAIIRRMIVSATWIRRDVICSIVRQTYAANHHKGTPSYFPR